MDEKKTEIFEISFWIWIFLDKLSSSGIRKLICYFGRKYTRLHLSLSRHSSTQKCNCFWTSLMLQHTFLQKCFDQFFNEIPPEASYLFESIPWKSRWFCALCHNLDSSNFKNCYHYWIISTLQHFFQQIRFDFCSCTSNSVKTGSEQKNRFFRSVCRFFDHPKVSNKNDGFRFLSIVKLELLREYTFDFFYWGPFQKPCCCRQEFDEKVFQLHPCIRIMRIQKVQKVLVITFYLDIRIHVFP